MGEHGKNFNKKTDNIKNQSWRIQLTKWKITLGRTNCRREDAEQIRGPEDRVVEITQTEQQEEKENSLRNLYNNIKHCNIAL